jgi:hypothetical protein
MRATCRRGVRSSPVHPSTRPPGATASAASQHNSLSWGAGDLSCAANAGTRRFDTADWRNDRVHEIAGAALPAVAPHRLCRPYSGRRSPTCRLRPLTRQDVPRIRSLEEAVPVVSSMMSPDTQDVIGGSSRRSYHPATPSHRRSFVSDGLAHSIASPSPHMEGNSAAKSECAGDGRRRLARCVSSIWYDPFRPRSSTPLLLCRFDGIIHFPLFGSWRHTDEVSFTVRRNAPPKGEGGVERKEMRSFVRISETDRPFGDVE